MRDCACIWGLPRLSQTLLPSELLCGTVHAYEACFLGCHKCYYPLSFCAGSPSPCGLWWLRCNVPDHLQKHSYAHEAICMIETPILSATKDKFVCTCMYLGMQSMTHRSALPPPGPLWRWEKGPEVPQTEGMSHHSTRQQTEFLSMVPKPSFLVWCPNRVS